MKTNFLLTITNGKAEVCFSENADELVNKYKQSNDECLLFIRPTPAKRKKAGNSEPLTKPAIKQAVKPNK
jgi:hypothetical protein